ncbi:MAG: hypothetical protein WAK17_27770 [Candidatus Nitrosopolaris sp.]|jgi:hypothetical protein
MKGIVNDAEKQIEQLIYEFVYDIASSGTEASKEFSYYFEILEDNNENEEVTRSQTLKGYVFKFWKTQECLKP